MILLAEIQIIPQPFSVMDVSLVHSSHGIVLRKKVSYSGALGVNQQVLGSE